MPRLAPSPALHSDADVLAVAEGLARLAGTDVAAAQLRRIYGERRAAEALMAVVGAGTAEASTCDADVTIDLTDQPAAGTGAVLRRSHPRHRVSPSRAYGPRPRAAGRNVYWL